MFGGGNRSAATIKRYVSSIGYAHRAAGVPNPADTGQHEIVRLALKRLSVAHRPRGQAQAKALTGRTLQRILFHFDSLGELTAKDLRDRALIATAYDTLCRREELVALRIEDIDRPEAAEPDLPLLDDDHSGAGSGTVTVRWGKGDQEGEGREAYLSRSTLHYVDAWLSKAGLLGSSGPIFRSLRRGGHVQERALPAAEVVEVFTARAIAAGVLRQEDLDRAGGKRGVRLTGHSARVGAAQDMAAAGIELPEMMLAGGWRSPTMPVRYARKAAAKRGGMAKLAEKQGR